MFICGDKHCAFECSKISQDDLLQELEEVSKEDTSTTRLSEENVIQIITKLQDTGLLEVVFAQWRL